MVRLFQDMAYYEEHYDGRLPRTFYVGMEHNNANEEQQHVRNTENSRKNDMPVYVGQQRNAALSKR